MLNTTRLRKRAKQGCIVVLAGVAFWLSYWHGVYVVSQSNEGYLSSHLYPLLSDALMTIASVLVVEDRRARRKPRPWAVVGMLGGLAFSTFLNLVDAYLHQGNWIAYIVAMMPAAAVFVTTEMFANAGEPLPAPRRRRKPAARKATPVTRLTAVK